MRELKFRAWDLKEKRWSYFHFSTPSRISWASPRHLDKWQQYIGYSDFEGEDIYEGDIVQVDLQYDGHVNIDYTIIGEVVFNEALQFVIKDYEHGEERWTPFYSQERVEFNYESLKIIGNIHENPELLK